MVLEEEYSITEIEKKMMRTYMKEIKEEESELDMKFKKRGRMLDR